MGKLIFGRDDDVECITPIGVKGAEGEDLCLAYKTSTLFVGAGVYMRDEGYVLGISNSWYYPLPEAAQLKSFQAQGLIPNPLPEYSVPLWKYGIGYSLWILIGVIVAFGMWSSARKKKRLREDAEAPVSVGPPALETEYDRHVNDTVRPMLKANEQIEQQAFGFPEPMLMNGDLVPGEKAAHGVLTNQRLLFVHVNKKPLAEVLSVDEVPRARIVVAVSDDGLMHFQLDDGTVLLLWVRRKEKGFSNQVRFIRDLPKIFPAGAAPVEEPVSASAA